MADLVVAFAAESAAEATVIHGLLDAHGVPSVVASSGAQSAMSLPPDPVGGIRILVRPDDLDRARALIAAHDGERSAPPAVPLGEEFRALERVIGYTFRDAGLLEQAMTHRSRAHEDVTGGVSDNESLEFLGDAVLGFLVADLLFREFPEFDEGRKSKAKATLVSTATLADLSAALGLGDHLLLGRGEEKTGGRRKQALLADGYEALIAALYLDGGVEVVRRFIGRQFAPLLDEVRTRGVGRRDFKSALQERLQSADRPLPEYRLVGATGPDHDKRFLVRVLVAQTPLAEGAGQSKKEAEQEAARLAIDRLDADADAEPTPESKP